MAIAGAFAALVVAWVAAALQCDEACTRDGHWWTDPASSQWSVQFGVALAALFATIAAVASLAGRYRRLSAVCWIVALVLEAVWAKLVLVDASFLG